MMIVMTMMCCAVDWLQGLNINLVFTTIIIVFGSSFQFGYNIGVLNQVDEVRSLAGLLTHWRYTNRRLSRL